MTISDLLTPDDVILDLRAADKRRLLEELAQRAARPAHIDSLVILEALRARETLGSTGMGAGIAIPHARLASLSRPIGLFARLRPLVEFDAIDGQRIDLVFLLLLPSQAQGEHLNALACVARRLRDEATTAALRAARAPHKLYAILAATPDRQTTGRSVRHP